MVLFLAQAQVMPRSESSIWNVELRSADNKQWTCSYCGDIHSGASSRIEAHLIGGSGDIRRCSRKLAQIPEQLL